MIYIIKFSTALLLLFLAQGALFYRIGRDFDEWRADDPAELRTRFLRRFTSIKFITKYTVYVVLVCVCAIVGLAVPFIQDSVLRSLLSALLLVGLWCEIMVLRTFSASVSPTILRVMFDNLRYGINAGVTHMYRDLPWWPSALIAFACIIYLCPVELSREVSGWFDYSASALFVFAICGVTIVSVQTKGHTTAFPPPFRFLACLFSAYAVVVRKPPEHVTFAGPITPKQSKIVIVVDESVRGDCLSLNECHLDTTPFLCSLDKEIANFGVATSASNTSIPSREVLRFCIPSRRLGDRWSDLTVSTTIWQYAKAAGYKTVHLDAFGTVNALSSNMQPSERVCIDERLTFERFEQRMRDSAIADALAVLLERDEKLFVFVEKLGTHIPYDRMYPSNENVFGADARMPFSLRHSEQLLKHYANALHWSVDGFFRRLLEKPLPKNSLIIYTSDHGQSLSEAGSTMSHGSDGPLQEGQLKVPLFVLSSDSRTVEEYQSAAEVTADRRSHFSIIPTALVELGYDPEWVRAEFGSTLKDISLERRKALYGSRVVSVGPPFD